MVPIFLFLGQASLGEVAKLPPAVPVRVAAAERWTIAPVPQAATLDPTQPRKVKVGKTTVTISPTAAFGEIDDVEAGHDGSLLIRRVGRQAAWSRQSSIWFAGKETPLPNLDVEIYRDRRNYAGSVSTDTQGPEGFVVEEGRRRPLGPGQVRYWFSGGTFILTVPIDAEGKPTGADAETSVATRVLEGKRSRVYPRFDFAGHSNDGSYLLAGPEGAVVRVRMNGGVDHWRLPPGWRVDGAMGGALLLRRHKALTPMPEIPKDGTGMEDWSKRMAEWQAKSTTEALANDRDWSAALLRNGTLIPLQFPRPPKTENLLWRETEILSPSSFRFTAFWGRERRAFRVAADPKN